ncbi:V-type ATP synthase subunit E [Tissierella praeacuta]|uniref:V-type ATP synthase subunit E n=1 Tax=Tissierella praeacuta TaxID=43131 RepID=UPI001043BB1E|nr:V-type ATP synthase subunit E [Tissierella praeacuta]TCU79398.1 vacuolar-type H+-ATPase subunit E/Vma4 [Tissierella praeacuta]
MITLEDKLDIFYKIVFKEEEAKCKKLLEELEFKNNSILEEKKIELEKKKEEIIERKRILAEIQKNEMVSKAVGESRGKILEKREEVLRDLISSLEDRARKFVLSSDYEGYLLNKIVQIIREVSEKEIIISITEIDKERFEDFILEIGKENNKDISLNLISPDIIGGFTLSDKDRSYNLDNSFKTIIEENKYLIGKRLYSSLEKTGGLNG